MIKLEHFENSFATHLISDLNIISDIHIRFSILECDYIRIGLSKFDVSANIPIGSDNGNSLSFGCDGLSYYKGKKYLFGTEFYDNDIVEMHAYIGEKETEFEKLDNVKTQNNRVKFFVNGRCVGIPFWRFSNTLRYPAITLYGRCVIEISHIDDNI